MKLISTKISHLMSISLRQSKDRYSPIAQTYNIILLNTLNSNKKILNRIIHKSKLIILVVINNYKKQKLFYWRRKKK